MEQPTGLRPSMRLLDTIESVAVITLGPSSLPRFDAPARARLHRLAHALGQA